MWQSIRAEATNSLLLDNGDFLQGNPMGDYIAYERGMAEGDMHPVIVAMNTLGFDASTLGNHEFNYGLDFLAKSVAGAAFPIVSANVVKTAGAAPTSDVTLVPPYVILDRTLTDGAGATHPIRIGVIGFVPPQIMNWDRKHLEGNVTARDIVLAAAAWVPQIKEEGADIIVALSHSGIGADAAEDGMENASVPLAAIAGIDAILTGHHHLVFPGPNYEASAAVDPEAGTLHGKPAVMAGFWGSHLGVVDLMLERDGRRGGWWGMPRKRGRSSGARRTARSPRWSMTIRRCWPRSRREHEETLAYVRRAVGKTAAPLHSYFALVADDPSVQIVSQAQEWYIAEMMKGTPHEGLPILSAAAPFKAGGRGGPEYYTDVPVGDVAIKNVADLYLYPNTVRAVKVTGAELKGWLERSAGMFNQITPGQPDQVLLNPDFPSYNFDVIDGVTYQIDLSQPAMFDRDGNVVNADANRIVNLSYQGQPVTDEMEFVIATNNYRASGRRQLPRRDGRHGHLRGAGHQPRRDRAIHRRAGHDRPQGRRKLDLRADAGNDGAVRYRARGGGLCRQRSGRGDRTCRRRAGRLRAVPHHAVSTASRWGASRYGATTPQVSASGSSVSGRSKPDTSRMNLRRSSIRAATGMARFERGEQIVSAIT
jgi:2',3'-cyclic-nucleotide 2'-phosphodiesterase / 3'-nucleotidase